jgi:hypothetical protein
MGATVAEDGKSKKEIKPDEVEDSKLEKEEKRTKARLRKRGPYRKAHANW